MGISFLYFPSVSASDLASHCMSGSEWKGTWGKTDFDIENNSYNVKCASAVLYCH